MSPTLPIGPGIMPLMMSPSDLSALRAAAFSSDASSGRAADAVWGHLLAEYQGRIPGSSLTPAPAETLLSPLPGSPMPLREEPGFLKTILERLEAGQGYAADEVTVFEARWPKSRYLCFDVIGIPTIFADLQVHLGGRLVFSGEEEDCFLLRIPSLTLLEAAFRSVCDDGFGWLYVPGEIPRDDMNAAHKRDRAPVGLPGERVYLGDFGCDVDGFVFALHDVYHGARMAVLPRPVRHAAVTLYDAVRSLPQEDQERGYAQDILDVLADMLEFRSPRLSDGLREFFMPLEREMRKRLYEGAFYQDVSAMADDRGFLDRLWTEWNPLLTEQVSRIAGKHFDHLRDIASPRPAFP